MTENPRSPEVRNTVLDGKFTTPFELFGNHTMVTGGQYFEARLTDQNPGRRTGLDETFSATQWALFVEDEWRIVDNFALTGGLRLDNHEKYGNHFSPRLYGVWSATEELTIKGGVSTGFRAPEIRQIAPGYAYTTGGGGCTYGPSGTCGVIIGDPGLEAEKSTSYEVAHSGTMVTSPLAPPISTPISRTRFPTRWYSIRMGRRPAGARIATIASGITTISTMRSFRAWNSRQPGMRRRN